MCELVSKEVPGTSPYCGDWLDQAIMDPRNEARGKLDSVLPQYKTGWEVVNRMEVNRKKSKIFVTCLTYLTALPNTTSGESDAASG